MVPEAFLLVEQIRPRGTQVDNLWAAVSILFKPCTLKAVKGIRDPLLHIRISA